MLMNNRFQGKTAVITGGATGMGFALAKRLGKEGASLAILDINQSALTDAVNTLCAEGIVVSAYKLDVSNPIDVAEIFPKIILDCAGKIDILINNAGIADFGTVETTEFEAWNKVMAINLNGTYLCSKFALPALKRPGGTIVNFGSVAGMVGIPNMAAYCASKAAVIGLTKQMAVDYAKLGIRVNCICPGMVGNTDMGQQILSTDQSEAMLAKRLSKYPIGRFGKSEEIVAAVLFLASDEASFVCGSAFTVDGAMTAV
jgi:NAD(P)-dependent dehydrogenase (short-subunit alcohol dehydrogenase family)